MVSYDDVDILKRFTARRGIRFAMLSDSDATIIAAFDLLNPRYPPGNRWHGLALPMLYVIDAAGTVSQRLSDTDFRWRPEPEEVLALLRGEG